MSQPTSPRGAWRRILSQSAFAGAGVIASPAEAVGDDFCTEIETREETSIEGRVFARHLAALDPFTATELATTSALNADVRVRWVLAEALAEPFALVGDAVIIEHLLGDAEHRIRAAARRAASARALEGVLERAAHVVERARVLVIDDYGPERMALCACVGELGFDAIGAPSAIVDRVDDWGHVVDWIVAKHDPPWLDAERLVVEIRARSPTLRAVVISSRAGGPAQPSLIHDGVSRIDANCLDDLAAALGAPDTRKLG